MQIFKALKPGGAWGQISEKIGWAKSGLLHITILQSVTIFGLWAPKARFAALGARFLGLEARGQAWGKILMKIYGKSMKI